ncbi:MAG: hypothetical protein ACJAXX_000689 [Roseivirga sp.]
MSLKEAIFQLTNESSKLSRDNLDFLKTKQ